MHNNYYFLKQVSIHLAEKIAGARVVECFSQNKDELIIVFQTEAEYFTIKAHLLSTFSCLSFPREFHRARKNSIDLFPEMIGCHLTSIQQYKHERSIGFHLTGNKTLLFKLHGNKSNIILFTEDKKVLFKNAQLGDENLSLEKMDRSIEIRFEAFVQHSTSLKKYFYTFGPRVWEYLEANDFATTKDLEAQWKLITETIALLEHPSYYLLNQNNIPVLSLLPYGEIIKEFDNPIEAINEFFYSYIQTTSIQDEKQKALGTLANKLKVSQSFLTKTKSKRNDLMNENTYKIWADILMANLHSIPERSKSISLPNFYDASKLIDIPLSETLSPQKNAERYYRKAKNQQLEINRLNEVIQSKEEEVNTLQSQYERIKQTDSLKDLRLRIAEFGIEKKKQKEIIHLPYRATDFQGFQIWIGKNAKSNDELTLKYSNKDDLWLHAKDVSGSHVLIKYQSGKPFPKEVLERGAQLAAYFSKRKTESLCPVAYTQKKFVRKRKGDPAGAVVVEKETVILVEPKGI